MSQKLPKVLPVFPLTGVLLLPGGRLPLHVFELRYRNMLEDALEGDAMIGIIQPRGLRQADDIFPDELPSPEAGGEPPLYDVGCVGHVERCEPIQEGGRYVILLRGVCRFRVEKELPPHRGYRRVKPEYHVYDYDEEETKAVIPSERIMEALSSFGEEHQIVFELDRLRDLPGLALLNSVAMALPFAPEEKQALLEAADVEKRLETLLTLMEMGIALHQGREPELTN